MTRTKSARARARHAKPAAARAAAGAPAGAAWDRGVALGFLAMLPLLACYELALARSPGLGRNLGEVVLSAPLGVLGERVPLARSLLLAGFAVLAAVTCFRAELGLAQRVWRTALEGSLAALALGPLLLLLLSLLGIEASDGLRSPRAGAAPLARAAFLCGGAAYEELVFRIGLQSLFFLVLVSIARFLGSPERAARWTAELGALVLAALVFAAAHLAVFLDVLGPGGERYDPAVFTWRALAGMLLGALFRWRGPGVAAWAHAVFNLALSIGAGPDVFL